jgi:hypothetical protein
MTIGDGAESHAAIYTGTEGATARTLGMVVIGIDSNIGYFDEGRDDRFYEDTAYPYAANGTLYLTEMRRHPNDYKNVGYFIVETKGCTTSETVTLSVTSTDRYGNSSTTQVGGPIQANGVHKLYARGASALEKARFVKPQVAFARGATTTASPQVVGKIQMVYDRSPMELD